MSKLFLTVLTFILVGHVFAQDSTYNSNQQRPVRKSRMRNVMKMDEEGDMIFNKQNVFGIRLASDGYGISFEKGYFKTPSKTLLYEFELNEKHDPHEHHVTESDDQGLTFSSLVPYKLNNLYELKAAIGEQRLLGGKGNKNGVAVTYLYAGGLTLGLLKPYLLDVSNGLDQSQTQMTIKDFIAANNANPGYQIDGAAGFTAGWGQLSFKPAVNAKQAMRFDYGRENRTVAAIEVGLTEEYYFGKVPLMYLVTEHAFFFNSYVTILFGSRK